MYTKLIQSIDDRFRYKLTIITNHIFQDHQSSFNESLMNNFVKDYFIKELNEHRKRIIKQKKYNQLRKDHKLIKMIDHFLAICSFEKREATDDRIHFHYLFSNVVEFENIERTDLVEQLEQETVKSYYSILERWKNEGKINEYYDEAYIPDREYIRNHPRSRGWISYIQKDANNMNHPATFQSLALNTLLTEIYNKR